MIIEPGAKVGGYVLGEAIAVRAFTVVHRAEHVALGRRAWIKALKPTVSVDSPYAEAIAREAKVLARLEHEGIVTLFELGTSEGALWMALEEVKGPTLAELLARKRVEPLRAAAIVLELALAIAHAHERGVVHGDLRPAIVVLPPGAAPKIIDFSAASIAGAPPRAVEGADLLGAPDFLAPEILLGEAANARSDVFALGAILHALIAGELPFAAEDARAVAQRIRAGKPTPLRDTTPDVPRTIEHAVVRCLALDPRDRFEGAAALAAALADAIAERTPTSPRALVAEALASAGLDAGTATVAPAPAQLPKRQDGPNLVELARALGVVLALIVGGAIGIEALRDDAGGGGSVMSTEPGLGSARDRGLLRVLAHPWAEVYVDGEHVETTPVARPILIAPGRHFVTFRHPTAPDEARTIKISAGQTILLDVTMRLDSGKVDAGPPDAGDSP